MVHPDKTIINQIHEGQETLNRIYHHYDKMLPVLQDATNYYSGDYAGNFWHQNADAVLVHMPVASSVQKGDVKVKFEVKRVTVVVLDGPPVTLYTDRIIPDGSCWSLEYDKDGNKYIQLELEKR